MDFDKSSNDRNRKAATLAVAARSVWQGIRTVLFAVLLTQLGCLSSAYAGTVDLQINIINTRFNSSQLAVLQESADYAEHLWESVLTGYQQGVSVGPVLITIREGSALASGGPSSFFDDNGLRFTKTGFVNINRNAVDIYDSWDGTGPPDPNTVDPNFIGLNYVDDILAHEIGHALGIGTLWNHYGVSRFRSTTLRYEYSGQYGLAAYRDEFDPNATFVPVETGGSPGTFGSHWDQRMRSDVNEGDPSDPWSLDPRQGIVDAQGRDLSLELMTGALDPDYGEPFLSNTTIQSFRDIGYTVIPEPGTSTLLMVAGVAGCMRRRRPPNVV